MPGGCSVSSGGSGSETKFSLFLPSVEFLGHHVSATGVQPTTQKVDTIHRGPKLKDVTQLKSFLGAVNYYDKFLNLTYQQFSLPPTSFCRRILGGPGVQIKTRLSRPSSCSSPLTRFLSTMTQQRSWYWPVTPLVWGESYSLISHRDTYCQERAIAYALRFLATDHREKYTLSRRRRDWQSCLE